jgi:predicted ATPase
LLLYYQKGSSNSRIVYNLNQAIPALSFYFLTFLLLFAPTHGLDVAIEQLSPGTQGIVLLLLYLAIDQQDRRPLIIDQPEENLDPNSVFEVLVPHFREARKRRQVIVVTHNANLVVNTDAD